MKKSNLYQRFVLLSKWEQQHFKAFLASPYFNKREDVKRLFTFLKEAIDPTFNRKAAFEYVYPNKIYKEKEVYLLFSYLYKLLEDFLAYQQIKKDKVFLKFQTAKAYQHLKQENAFQQKIKESKTMLEKKVFRNAEYWRLQYDLEAANYDAMQSSQRSSEAKLEEVMEVFDIYYISEKLRYHCFQLSQMAISSADFNTNMLEEVLRFVENQPVYLEHPSVSIYYHYYKAIIGEKEEQHFQTFREKIELYKAHFSNTELYEIYLAAINICIKRVNQGIQEYVLELFELHKTGIEQGLLLRNGELSPFAFKNMVSVSIKLQKLDWLDQFIQAYQDKLNPTSRASTVQYATAMLRYEQKNYKAAMQLLATLESEDFLLILSAKMILLKIYYELQEFDALEALLESMRISLQRKKQMGYHKEVYQNVIRMTKKLIALPPFDAAKRAQLKIEAAAMKPQSLRTWFLEQLDL